MKNKIIFLLSWLFLIQNWANAQGLEGIMVEKYYQANAADAQYTVSQGYSVQLPQGAVTYRIFVDMAPGYKFVQMFGTSTQNLNFSTSTFFYNDENYDSQAGPTTSVINTRKHTAMIDSWITTGGVAGSASNGKVGVPKVEDTDASIATGANGNTNNILFNALGGCFGTMITTPSGRDGLLPSSATTYVSPNVLGMSGGVLDALTAGNSLGVVNVTNGSIAALGGVVGATSNNRVLVGQFTTDGTFTFAINIQLLNPSGVAENYVHSNVGAGQLTHPTLTRTASAPSVNIVSDAAGNQICTGGTISFTATPVNAGIASFQWKVNGVNVGTNSSTFSSSSLTNGNIVTCVVTPDCGASSNTAVTSNAITISVASPTNYYADTDGDGFGAGTALNACTNPGAGYVINNTDCDDANAQVNTSATEICNQIDDDCDTQVDEGLSVTPAVSIASNDSDNSICSGSSVTFTATPTNGGSTPAYQWKVNGVNVGTNASTFTSTTLSNNDAVTVVMTANNACQTSSTATSNSISTTVINNVAPMVSIISNDADNSICLGSSVTFTATPSNGGSTPDYQWKVNGVNVGTNASTFTSTTLSNNDAVTVVMTANNTCQSTLTATSNSISTVVINNVTPTVSIVSNDADNSICSGSSVTFTATPTNGGSTPAYQWKVNGVNVGTNASTFTSTTLSNGDAVTVVMTANNTCQTSSMANGNSISMTVLNNISFYYDLDGDGFGGATELMSCTNPGVGYVTNNTDCNDDESSINTAASEICDEVDNNCNGEVDEFVQSEFYGDLDGDGFGDISNVTYACSVPAGFVLNADDCDDSALSYEDIDGDGYGVDQLSACGALLTSDCNDEDENTNPGTLEICDEMDNNCNGEVDEFVQSEFYGDLDDDGFGDINNVTYACSVPAGFVLNADDCDDTALTFEDMDGDGYGVDQLAACGALLTGDCNDEDANTNPGTSEICDEVDNNCNGEVDEFVQSEFYGDLDGDGFGDINNIIYACSVPAGFVLNADDCDDSAFTYEDMDGDGYGVDQLTACGALLTGDCNDEDANTNPGTSEICDEVDNNCNGEVDEFVQSEFYGDLDGDGFGDISNVTYGCSVPAGFVLNADDCDDSALSYEDIDGDGYGVDQFAACGALLTGDCNDEDENTNPGTSEICDEVDNNCNGEVDEFVQSEFYGDLDGDGFGDISNVTYGCSVPAGFVLNADDCDDSALTYEDMDGDGYGVDQLVACGVILSDDCDDSNASAYPSALEICGNGIDENCDGIDEDANLEIYYLDADGDGFGDAFEDSLSCNLPVGYVLNGDDCDDTNVMYLDIDGDGFGGEIMVDCGVTNSLDCDDENIDIFPGAEEVCDGIDQNCDGSVDEGLLATYFADEDNDGFGDALNTQEACSEPTGYTSDNSDCNDLDALVNPSAVEICNDIDDNCDGETDELVQSTYYADNDGDGFGDENNTEYACEPGVGFVTDFSDCDDQALTFSDLDGDGVGDNSLVACGAYLSGDCDDQNIDVNPDMEDICENGVDENCDGEDAVCQVLGCTDPTAFNFDSAANTDDGSCIPAVVGCTDVNAFNYNPTANIEDGSCVPVILGCTDMTAINYVEIANIDDGSCIAEVLGCTDASAFNYNSAANTDDGSCIAVVLGCTDATAFNYNSEANTDDGSCIAEVLGCTDAAAVNYNPAANTDDGSCIAVVLGCTDATAFNYNPAANTNDGSCIAVVLGCTDATAINYNPSANTNDGSCIAVVLGCTDATAFNYNPAANTNDGSCIAVVLGCTDAAAFNYNAAANTNDGSCIAVVLGCTDATAFNYNPSANTNDGSCIAVVSGCTDATAFNYNPSANTNDGSCIAVVTGCTDATAFNYNPSANTNDGSCIAVVLGCTDPTAFNYNAAANTNDGSCLEVILGCTDVTALNYDAEANTNDGSCIAVVLGCTDVTAFNYNPSANTEDGSCLPFVLGCLDQSACNYDALANTDNGTCIYPQTEVCNEVDDNCDGEIDEFVQITFYADVDGDGFGDNNNVTFACSQPAGYVENFFDCDDNAILYMDTDGDGYGSSVIDACGVVNTGDCLDFDDTVNPGATEVCDGFDQNCDGIADENLLTTYYADQDNDGFGDANNSVSSCTQDPGYVLDNADCDDTQLLYVDADQDGYGTNVPAACGAPNTTDCNDTNTAVNPGAVEVPNNAIDEDCDGEVVDVEQLNITQLSVFPVPAMNQFQVNGLDSFKNQDLIVLDAQGRRVFVQFITQDIEKFDCSHWSNGMYTLHIAGESGSIQIIIAH